MDHPSIGDQSTSVPSTVPLPSTRISCTTNDEEEIRTYPQDRLLEPSPGNSPDDDGINNNNNNNNSNDNSDGVELLPPQQGWLLTTLRPPRNGSRRVTTRCLVGVLLLGCIVFVLVDFAGDRTIESALVSFLNWTKEHRYKGMIAVVLCYVVATICFVPGSLLSFGAGFAIGSSVDTTALGIALASSCVFIGASIGSICSFLLGRYLFRDCVLQLAFSYPIFQAIERALEMNGLKIMVLLRLSPLIPYNALDYISGVTSISLRDYSIAMLAMIPGIVMLCSIGASASSLSDRTSSTSNTTMKVITIVSGLLFGGCGVFLASYYSKLELDRILAEQSTEHTTMYLAHGFSQEEGNEMEAEPVCEDECDEEIAVDDDDGGGGDDEGCVAEPRGTPVTNASFA